MARDRNDIIKEAKEIQRELNKLTKEGTALTAQQLKRQEELVQKQKELRLELKQSIQQRLDLLKSEESSISSISSMYQPLQEAQRESLSIASQMNNLSEDQITAVNEIQRINRDIASLSIEDIQSRSALTNEYLDQLSVLKEQLHGNTKLVQSLKQQNSLANDYANLTRDEKSALDLQNQAAEKLKQTFQGISETVQTTVMRLFSVKGVMGGILFASGELVSRLSEVNRELGQVGKGLGNGAGSATVLGLAFKDSVGATKALAQELGGTEQLTFKTQLNTNLIANNLGISTNEAGVLIGQFSRLNEGSTAVAADMIATSREFAYQNNIIPSQLMSDLANSAEQFALFGKQGGRNIVEAAGFAARLGVNMGTVSGIAENLLDFESSITKELELGAMLGRNINLNKARELAFTGDIEGATKETLKALGGAAAFEQMNYYQRKQTADLLGVSVAELQKMVDNQEKMSGPMGFMQKTFNSITESANALGNSLGGKIAKGAGSLLMTASQAGAQFKMMGLRIPLLEKGLSKIPGVSKVTDSVKGVSEKASESVDIAKKTPGKSDGGLRGLAKGLRAMGDPKVLFGALNLIPTSLGFIAILPGIPGMIAVALLGGPAGVGLRLLGQGLKAFGNSVAKALPQIGLGLLVLAGFGAALIPLAYSLSLAAPAITAFGDVISSAFSGIATIITAVSQGLVSMLGVITLEKAAAMLGLAAAFPLLAVGIGALAIAATLGGGKVTSFIQGIAEGSQLLAGGAAQGLQTTAQAMMSMGSGLAMINDQLDRLNPEKLEALSKFSMSLSIGGAMNAVGEAVGGLVDSVTAVIGGNDEEGSLSQYETDALRYLERIAVATEKGATIKGRDRTAFNPMGIANN